MQKNFTIYFISILLLSGILSSCKVKKLPQGEVEVIVPCSGSDYFTDSKTFRANSIGESYDQVTSKKKALSNARAEIASSINTLIKSVTDNYVNSREMNNKELVEEKYEGLAREIVDQELHGIVTICEKQTKTNEGKYKTYIAIELSAEKLLKAYNKRMETLDKEEVLRIDYDYEKFKKTFEEEMKKMKENN